MTKNSFDGTSPNVPNDANKAISKHPKVMLIDLDAKITEHLKTNGVNASSGTFGAAYHRESTFGYTSVDTNYDLPFLEEQEIIIVDLKEPAKTTISPETRVKRPGQKDVYVHAEPGLVNPRKRAMYVHMNEVDRILDHGGALIIFSAPQRTEKHYVGEEVFRKVNILDEFDLNNWEFSRRLSERAIEIIDCQGSEFLFKDIDPNAVGVLEPFIEGAVALCTFSVNQYFKKSWMPLAKDKYGRDVAGLFIVENDGDTPSGLILLLPQVADKEACITNLLESVLPSISPNLFPDVEKPSWVNLPEYEHPQVLEIDREIEELKASVNLQIQELEAKKQLERDKNAFLHTLLKGDGKELVLAVKKALEELGFTQVIDVDEQVKASDAVFNDEDLQIADGSPLVLVEVKGLSNYPKDEDALAVQKYLAPRMKELNRLDIIGLSIINHQKHIPPKDRDNTNVFRELLLVNAERHGIGLMTSWDLFRLVQCKRRLSWEFDSIRDIFYKPGRTAILPSHYELIGEVEQVWDKASAASIEIKHGELQPPCSLAFECGALFHEQLVDEIRLEGKVSDKAIAGEFAGVKVDLSRSLLKPGTRVFKINPQH
ncbi:hypothetical protein D3C72_440170 [compost metagenome]